MKHASFFSGAGGLDIGFERAGISTVSVSEVDPYACAVLAERFPDAPNLGDITEVKADDIPEAQIWSGGFPCQDLSVAGKRAGFAGKRSSLAFTFLDLVRQQRPRWVLLENVPGLLTSNGGADFGRLLHEMEQLGYGVAWRTLDAQHFGVPQQRRRVFIIASLESDRAAEVLLECEGCERHPAPGWQEGEAVASIAPSGAGGNRQRETERQAGQENDANRMREIDGLSRRMDNQSAVVRKSSFGQYKLTDNAGTLRSSGGDIGGGSENLILTFPVRFGSNAKVTQGKAQSMAHSAGAPAVLLDSVGDTHEEDNLLPIGLDSHRYRLCGNGVVAPVAEWIGRRIVEADRRWREEEAK